MNSMNFGLKKPCKECPYMARVKGWIGSHESPMEFHDLVKHDVRMACHMTVNQCDDNSVKEVKHHCAGYALYMNAMCKMSTDPEMAELQNEVRQHVSDDIKKELLFSFDGSKLIEFHQI